MIKEEKETIPELSPEAILNIFKSVGGYLEGHFLYTSNRHGDIYFNKDAVYPHTLLVSEICREIARRYQDTDVEMVVGPAIGGIVLAQYTAFHLSEITEREVLAAYVEKTKDGVLRFSRGYDELVKGRRVLGVEDTMTTGNSLRAVRDSITQAGGELFGACAIVNRDPGRITTENMGMNLDFLLGIDVESYAAEECPMCAQGIPLDRRVGKGKEL